MLKRDMSLGLLKSVDTNGLILFLSVNTTTYFACEFELKQFNSCEFEGNYVSIRMVMKKEMEKDTFLCT